MLKKVLFPTNLTPSVDILMNCLKDLKAAGVEEIILIHVVALIHEGISLEFQENDRSELENRKKILEQWGFKVCIRVPIGIPSTEIIKASEEEDVSLIVIGIHELGIIEDAMMGSIPERIIRNTKKPILIYRIKEIEKPGWKGNNLFKKILYPTDWSKCAKAVIPFLKDLPHVKNQDISILHVMDKRVLANSTSIQIKKFKQIDNIRLKELKKELKKYAISTETKLLQGLPFHQINAFAKKEKVTLVIMGSHGKGFIKEMEQGSTAEKIIRFGTAPILLINNPD
ncbi:universal stress protein [Candidatus Poribacteria bacterium]|nr:universal stress protein [Candidatus Poribacteria bacterium]